MNENIKKRFLEKVEMIPECGCWIFLSGVKNNGYGHLMYKNKQTLAHRFSYELFISKIPDGMCICHTCDTKSCVNPNHLFLGTHTDNMRDASKKRRLRGGGGKSFGETNGSCKLTSEKVIAIRSEIGTQKSISIKYGVSQATIHKIKHRIKWSHI